jgi:hypothetical protein
LTGQRYHQDRIEPGGERPDAQGKATSASTNTTRPTKPTTYLPNNPLGRNQLLRASSIRSSWSVTG